jgi:hypothetical protein
MHYTNFMSDIPHCLKYTGLCVVGIVTGGRLDDQGIALKFSAETKDFPLLSIQADRVTDRASPSAYSKGIFFPSSKYASALHYSPTSSPARQSCPSV